MRELQWCVKTNICTVWEFQYYSQVNYFIRNNNSNTCQYHFKVSKMISNLKRSKIEIIMAKKKGLQFTQNFIEHSIGNNFTKAFKVSTYHFDKLTADAALGDATAIALLALFAPKHNALKDFTTAKGVDLGGRKAKTATVKTLLQQVIDTELPAWQLVIQGVYAKKSDDYKAFFPQGNDPFILGKIDDRIEAIRILHDVCVADGHAIINATLAGTINTFYTTLLNTRAAASGKKGDVKGDAGSQKAAIHDMCVQHFSNVGALIAKYPEDPDKINSYIDFVTLMDHHHSTQYNITLHADELKKALAHKFTANSTIIVSNTGEADLKLYVAEKAKDKVHPAGITVAAGTMGMVIHISDISAKAGNRILMVKNLDATNDGACEILVGDTTQGVVTDPHD